MSASPEASRLDLQPAAFLLYLYKVGWVLISSYKDTGPVGLGLTLVTSFYFNHLFEGPVFKYGP